MEPLERRTLLSSGDLDPTFGTGGKVTTDIPGAASDELIRGIAVQSDGKIVEVAWHGGFGSAEPRLAVTRFNTDGSVDTSFGDNGLQVIDYPGRSDFFGNIAVGPEDQVVVTGWSNFPATNPLPEDQDVLVAVLNADGSFDTSFDGDGIRVIDFGQAIGGPTAAKTNDLVFDVAVQDDGKVVTAGTISIDGVGRFALARLNRDGTLDSTFDGDGVVTHAFTGGYQAIANSVDTDASGRIVVAGQAGIPSGSPLRVRDNDFAVARYNPDGSFDTTFDGKGWTITPFGTLDDIANQVEVAPNGKIVVGGGTQTGTTPGQDVAIARYNPNGTLDTTFSGDGKATYALTNATGGATNETASGMAVQADGSVLFSGRNTQGIGTSVETFLVRLTPSGVPDPGFGTNGKVTVPELGSALALAVQPADQYVLVGGTVNNATTGFSDFGVARFDTAGNPDPFFGPNGNGVANADFMANGFNSVTGGAVQADGKVIVAGFTLPRGTQRDMTFVRYNADGTLDDTFGDGGIVSIDLAPGFGQDVSERVSAVTLDADGKLVFVGILRDPNTNTDDMFVGRLNTDGSIDFDFAFGFGILQVGSFAGNPNANEIASDVLVDPDGRIVVVGEYSPSSTVREFAIMRLDAGGGFDTSFGPDGSGGVHVPVTGPTGGLSDAAANAVALAPDQDGDGYDIVVAGRARISSNDQFALVRLNDDGFLDTSFDGDGKVTTLMGSAAAVANDVTVDSAGRIVVAGQARGSNNDFALARYTPAGALDTAFGSAGKVLTDFDGENDTANSLVILPDGSILAGGTASANWGLARYSADGVLHTSFATAGRARTDFAAGFYPGSPTVSRDQGVEVFAYDGDRAVMVGSAFPPTTGNDFAAARYVLTGPPNTPPVADAGGPYSMQEGATITLSGAASSDADGRVERYEWDLSYDQFLGFSTDAFGERVPFTASDEGPKRVALRVTDEDGAMHLVQVTVNVTNANPVVSAGPDATIDPGGTFTANGSFTDPGAGDTWTGSVDYGDGQGFQTLALATNKTFALSHTYATPGTYTVTVRVRDNDGGEGTDTVLVNVRGAENHVTGRKVFYYRSKFDTTGGGPLGAVPDQKTPLLPGQTAVGTNITNYTRGINGIIVTLDGAPGGEITAADFRFKVGTGGNPDTWADAPAPERVEVRGVAGSPEAHVVITWADGAIKNKWLQVTTLANARTKLASPDTFYYGNLVGNAASPPARIDAADYLRTRAGLSRVPVPITNPSDHDHDGQVTVLDVAAVKANLFQSIQLITAPAAAAAAPATATSAAAPAVAGSTVWAAAVTARREAARATDLLK